MDGRMGGGKERRRKNEKINIDRDGETKNRIRAGHVAVPIRF